jgi:hypothetical protein
LTRSGDWVHDGSDGRRGKGGLAFAPSHLFSLQVRENNAKCLRRMVPPSMLLSHGQQGKPLPGSAARRSMVQGRRVVAMKEGGDKGGKKGDDDEKGTFIDDLFKPLVA